MDSLADALGTAGKWLVLAGIALFIVGFFIDAFTVAGRTPTSAIGTIGEVIGKAMKIAFDAARPPGQRMSAGGVLLIGLGLISLLGGLASSELVGDGNSGEGTTPTPSPT